MLHCSMTHTLARTRAYQYFCFLLSHLSQHSRQTNKYLIINTINSTSKWKNTHFTVTLLSHYYHAVLPTPPLHPIEQNLLSHYYHTTITPLSPRPFLFPKSTSSPKNQCIPSKKSHISPKTSDIFSKKSLISSKKWDIIEESAHLGCAALWQMWQKKTQNSWYIRAREKIDSPKR